MINIYIFFSFTLTWPQSSWGREGSQQSHQKSQLLPAGHISLSPRVTGEVTLNFNNQQQMIRHGATRQERWRDGAFWPRLWCLWFVLGQQQSNVPAAFLFSFGLRLVGTRTIKHETLGRNPLSLVQTKVICVKDPLSRWEKILVVLNLRWWRFGWNCFILLAKVER